MGKLGLVCTALLGLGSLACASHASRYAIQWDARDQIWLAETSQVKVRSAQSRVLDTSDKQAVLRAVVTTLQDLDFQIEVLDDVLGVVSAKRFWIDGDKPSDPYYWLYDDESLVAFIKSYRTWGPFEHRSDRVRLTVTVRRRNARQLVVRASAQDALRPLEEPKAYQRFFRTLEHALFTQRQLAAD